MKKHLTLEEYNEMSPEEFHEWFHAIKRIRLRMQQAIFLFVTSISLILTFSINGELIFLHASLVTLFISCIIFLWMLVADLSVYPKHHNGDDLIND